MEEKELLRIIILFYLAIVSFFFPKVSIAENSIQITKEDKTWPVEITENTRTISLKSILDKFKELKTYQKREWEINEIKNPSPILRVFVSTSMSENSLRQHHKQAVKYGGVLVFKGLPNGSFKELAKIIMSITNGDQTGVIQIDDEAFKKFGVQKVPVIILSKEENCLSEQSCKIICDRITGNIGLRLALEKIAEEGELALHAREILQ